MSGYGDMLNWVRSQLGKPYVWGGSGPDGFDCSGLTQGAFRAAGYNIPRTSQEQRDAGMGVPLSQIRPGDLVTFTYPDSGGNPGPGNHVALYVGGGQVIAARHRGVPVQYQRLDVGHVDRVRRILGTTVPDTGSGAGAVQADDVSGGSVSSAPGLQQAGYDAVINLTPWGIPLNPFKLPGWIWGKGQELGRNLGGSGPLSGGMADAVSPVIMASLGVLLAGGLILIGAFVTVRPAIESTAETVGKFQGK